MKWHEVAARATGRLLVLLLLVAVPAGVYVFVVVKNQESFHTARNLRAVGEIGALLDDRLDALVQIARTFPQLPVNCAGADCIATEQKTKIAQLRTSEWFRNLTAGIAASPAQCPDKPTARQTVTRGDRQYSLLVHVDGQRDTSVVVTRCDAQSTPHLVLTVPLHDLVGHRHLESGFDAMVIADCRGEVLHSDSTRQIAVVDVASLMNPKAGAGTTATKKDDSSDKPQACVGRGESWAATVEIAGAATRVFARPYRPSNVAAVAGGDSATPAAATIATPATWYLLGLRSDAAFKRSARVLPFELLVIVSPLIVVALLAWPFMVIALSGAGVRFGAGAPLSFALAALGGAGLLAIIVLGLAYHYDAATLRDRLLDRLAADFVAELSAEIKEGLDTLPNVQREIAECGRRESTAGDTASHGKVPLAPKSTVSVRDETCFTQFGKNQGAKLLKAAASFETAFQLDYQGQHVGYHLSLRDSPSSRIRLDDRAYFKRGSRGPLWELRRRPSVPFAIEQIRSKEFGWLLSAIVSPTSPNQTSDDKPGVTILVKRMQTFFEPILPAGVSFAVVRDSEGSVALDGPAWRRGDVLFHSDDSRSLVENLLSETGDDPALAVALAERRRSFLNVDYRGRPYRFHVTPLPVPSWTLVVAHDKGLLRMLTLRNVLGSTAAFLCYVFAMAVLVWFVERAILRRPLPSWLWPDGADRSRHRSASIALLALSVLLWSGTPAWIGPSASSSTLWLVTFGSACCIYGLLTLHFARRESRAGCRDELGPARAAVDHLVNRVARSSTGTIVFVIGFLLIGSSLIDVDPPAIVWSVVLLAAFAGLLLAPSSPSRSEGGSDACYVLFLVSVLAAVSAVPATMFLRDMHGFHQEAYEKHDLEHIAASAVHREAALRDEARRLQPGTFDRADVPPFEIPDEIWCRGFFGFGARPLFKQCPRRSTAETAMSTDAPPTLAKNETAAETIHRTATSWFSVAIPADGREAFVFADGWRMARDDGALEFRVARRPRAPDAGSPVIVAANQTPRGELAFASAPKGLFDRDAHDATGADVKHVLVLGLLVLGTLLLTVLTWRVLATVVATFFGPKDLRRRAAAMDAAESSAWNDCSVEEKLVLRHLADSKLINIVRNERVIERLLAKGFVEFDPGLRIRSEALAQHIASADCSDQELAFERESRGGSWSELRMPFFIVLGLAIIVIVVAAPNALSSVMAVLAASAGGVGVLVQIMNLMLRGKH